MGVSSHNLDDTFGTTLNTLLSTPITETPLISYVFNRLLSEEHAQHVVFMDGGNTHSVQDEILFSSDIALITFGASNISGNAVLQAGKMCPYHVLYFVRRNNASDFLNKHEMNLRLYDV